MKENCKSNQRLIVILMLPLVLLSAYAIVTPKENVMQADDYELIFSDEFDGLDDSRPDTSVWRPCRRYAGQWSRWISASPDVAFIRDGSLVCRAIPNDSEPEDTATMLTGAVETRGKFSFQYGKIEVRMRTNLQQGNFPAAWLVPTYDDGDKRYGEIDIVEMFGYDSRSFHTLHTHRSLTLHKDDIKRTDNYKVDVTEWHVYGVIWTSRYVAWTVDGYEVFRYNKINTPLMEQEGQWTFDRPYYIRLNQSVGDGLFPKMIPHTDEVYETEFDWVRVYKEKE